MGRREKSGKKRPSGSQRVLIARSRYERGWMHEEEGTIPHTAAAENTSTLERIQENSNRPLQTEETTEIEKLLSISKILVCTSDNARGNRLENGKSKGEEPSLGLFFAGTKGIHDDSL